MRTHRGPPGPPDTSPPQDVRSWRGRESGREHPTQPHVYFPDSAGGYQGGRAASQSPGAGSVRTEATGLGDEERGVLTGVIAKLQQAMDVAGEPGTYDRTSDLERIRSRMHTSDTMESRSEEDRQQLKRAGIVIAQQLETSSRKDILMDEQDSRHRIEKLNAQVQLERMYDLLTNERSDRCASEDALLDQIQTSNIEKQQLISTGREQAGIEQSQHAQEIKELEERLASLQEAHNDTLSELKKKEEEVRQEYRNDLQDAAERQEKAVAEAEARHHSEKEEFENTNELLLQEIQELEARLAMTQEAYSELCDCAMTTGTEGVSIINEESTTRYEQISEELQQAQEAHAEQLEQETQRHEEEVNDLRQQLEEAQSKGDSFSEDQRLALEDTIMEHERLRAELESNLRSSLPDLNRLASREDSHLLEELLLTQQETGRISIMHSQLQELLAFILTRYAPHLMEDSDSPDSILQQHPNTKHRSIFPSYWGWMFRSSGMFVSWQRRFFVVRDGILKIGTSDTGTFQTLVNTEAIAKVELDSFSDASQGNHPPTGKYESFGFMVETYSKQKIRFCCTSSSERSEWMSVLRKCIEIRLGIERTRAYTAGTEEIEPYLYLEDCSPPDPPPTYRTRVRLADAGAYPMLGPGSPPRSRLPYPAKGYPQQQLTQSIKRDRERPPASPKYGNPMRPTLLSASSTNAIKGGSTMPPGHRAGLGQHGGASGVGVSHLHLLKGPKKRDLHSVPGGDVPPTSRTPAKKTSGGQIKRRGSRITSTTSISEAGADSPFEGSIAVDVLVVKSIDAADDYLSAEDVELTRNTAHAFNAKYKQGYQKIQIFYAAGAAAASTSEIYGSVLESDQATQLQGMSPGGDPSKVIKLLTNMSSQPAVAGGPSSLLIILIGIGDAVDDLTQTLAAENDILDTLPETHAALYSSLFEVHRGGVTWTFVRRITSDELTISH
eukprot:TRINITY_DN11671_c0_g1_i1.p1 TRINITY_DN11671_c0_g1~~TRINITY_DN11671_c0_g1_i1.p1  ORF type:complete len:952 (+),score=233.06 TRINITY_DN11671_c0_g1_i1:33-2888(+)